MYKRGADGIAKKGKTEGKNLGDSGPIAGMMHGGKGKGKGKGNDEPEVCREWFVLGKCSREKNTCKFDHSEKFKNKAGACRREKADGKCDNKFCWWKHEKEPVFHNGSF